MEHPQIDDEKVIDRYLAGLLGAEEEASFEEHLFACADCLEQVQWGEELRRGVRAVAAEEVARVAVSRGLLSLGLVAWLRSRRPGQLAGLAGLALALVVLPVVVLRQQTELSRLRSAVSSPASAGLTQPMGDLAVVSLGRVRGTGDEVVEIRPEPRKEAVVLSLELPMTVAPRYRVTLRDGGGEVRWRGEGLEPNLYGTLLIVVPSAFLAPGSYRITLEGLSAAGTEPAGEMEFRVLPEK